MLMLHKCFKEDPIMHILYFGYLATDLLDFYQTPVCVAMVTILAKDILQIVRFSAAYCN